MLTAWARRAVHLTRARLQQPQLRCEDGTWLFDVFSWTSGDVVLDSSAKSAILSAETTLEATDSDPHPELGALNFLVVRAEPLCNLAGQRTSTALKQGLHRLDSTGKWLVHN